MSSLGGSQTDLTTMGIADMQIEYSEPLFGMAREGSNLSDISANTESSETDTGNEHRNLLQEISGVKKNSQLFLDTGIPRLYQRTVPFGQQCPLVFRKTDYDSER